MSDYEEGNALRGIALGMLGSIILFWLPIGYIIYTWLKG